MRPEPTWCYRLRNLLVHDETGAWIAAFAWGVLMGAILFYGGNW